MRREYAANDEADTVPHTSGRGKDPKDATLLLRLPKRLYDDRHRCRDGHGCAEAGTGAKDEEHDRVPAHCAENAEDSDCKKADAEDWLGVVDVGESPGWNLEGSKCERIRVENPWKLTRCEAKLFSDLRCRI